MKMFKKLFAVLVLGFMSVLFLTACDGKMQDGVTVLLRNPCTTAPRK